MLLHLFADPAKDCRCDGSENSTGVFATHTRRIAHTLRDIGMLVAEYLRRGAWVRRLRGGLTETYG